MNQTNWTPGMITLGATPCLRKVALANCIMAAVVCATSPASKICEPTCAWYPASRSTDECTTREAAASAWPSQIGNPNLESVAPVRIL